MCVPEKLTHFVKCRFSQLVHRPPHLTLALGCSLLSLLKLVLAIRLSSVSVFFAVPSLPHLQRRRQHRYHAGQRHRQFQRERQRQYISISVCIREMRIALASAAEILVSFHTHRTYAYAQLYHRAQFFFLGGGLDPFYEIPHDFERKRRRSTGKS